MIAVQLRTSQRGNKFAFVQLSDSAGPYEIMMFSEALAASRELLESGEPVLVQAAARIEEGQLRLNGQSVRPLNEAAANAPTAIRVWIDDGEPLTTLKTLVEEKATPRAGQNADGRISLAIPDGDQEVIVRLSGKYICTPQIRQAMRAVPGVLEVLEL